MTDAVMAIQAVAAVGPTTLKSAGGGALGSSMAAMPSGTQQQQAQKQFEAAMSRAERAQTDSPAFETSHQGPSDTRSVYDMSHSNYATSSSFGPVHSTVNSLSKFTDGLQNRFKALQQDAMSLGENYDVTQPSSVVIALDRQMKITSASIEMQMVLQSAENVKHSVKSMTQMQG